MASQLRCTSKSVDLLQTYHQYISTNCASLQTNSTSLGQATYYAGKRRTLNVVATMAHCAKEGYISAITTNMHPVLPGINCDNKKPPRQTGRCFCACPPGKSGGSISGAARDDPEQQQQVAVLDVKVSQDSRYKRVCSTSWLRIGLRVP